eukprot:SAG31_NODE_6925_length_1847_cov_2.743135_1_plen_415_part_00
MGNSGPGSVATSILQDPIAPGELNFAPHRRRTPAATAPVHPFSVPGLRERFPHYDMAVAHYAETMGDSSEAQYYVAAKLARLEPSTAAGYSGKFTEFAEVFCRPRQLTALPATLDTVCRYIGWQLQKGTVQGSSMGQYLSAINYFHTSIDLPPAVPKDGRGHYPKGVRDAISGMQKLQVGGKRDRVYLPAEHISRILDDALQAYPLRDDTRLTSAEKTLRQACERFRNDVASVFNYADFCRSDSGAAMKTDDIGLDSTGMLVFRVRKAKGRAQVRSHLTFQWPPGVLTDVKMLLRQYLHLRTQLHAPPSGLLWKLPWERTKFGAGTFAAFKSESLSRRGISAPAPFVYQPHSWRSGPASEATALGVPYDTVCYCGGWAIGSNTPRDSYIDFSCPPSPAGARFFGHLRPPPPQSP